MQFAISTEFLLPSVVLGAGDPEMNTIQTALARLGVPFCFALGKDAQGNVGRVHPGNAYKACDVGAVTDDGRVMLEGVRSDTLYVECEVQGCTRVNVADHHRPGDAGYGVEPAGYWQASSIGQVYSFLQAWGRVHLVLGWDQETLDRAFGPERFLVAASDHCPGHAFQGKCPGIDVSALRDMRRRNAASFQKKDLASFNAEVDAAVAALQALPEVVTSAGTYRVSVADIPQLNHAQLELGVPVEYRMAGNARDPRTKVGLLGGEPALIKLWMASKAAELVSIYGDPERGYAGGYLPG